MHRFPKFPFLKTAKKMKLKFDVLDSKWIPKLCEMFEVNAASGRSVGMDERLEELIRQDPISEESSRIQVTNRVSGAFLGALLVYPCPVSRSTRPVSAAASILLDPSIRGLGIGSYMREMMHHVAWECGYLSINNRISLHGANLHMTLNHNQVATGVLPYSRLTPSGTREADVVIHQNYRSLDPEEYDKRLGMIVSEKAMMYTPTSCLPPAWVWDELEIPFLPVPISDGDVVASIQSATLADISPIEMLIREAAADGRGFSLDEFQDGFFNRRLLQKSHVLCAKTPDGTLIGGAIFGTTAICRSKTAPIFSVYIVVHPSYYRQGIGRILLKHVEQLAKQHGMIGVFVDTFITDQDSSHFLTNCGYICTATFPMSGFVHKYGLTDTMLWYKPC